MKIYKYELNITDKQRIQVPGKHLRPLSVAEQYGKLMLWAIVSDEPPDFRANHTELEITIIGTGNPAPDLRQVDTFDGMRFIGTVVMSDGLVWHVFAKEVPISII